MKKYIKVALPLKNRLINPSRDCAHNLLHPIHAHESEILMNSPNLATNDCVGGDDDRDEGAKISLQVSTGQTTDASCEMKIE
jgi:hypothetical protein